jgi:hypothetical protein
MFSFNSSFYFCPYVFLLFCHFQDVFILLYIFLLLSAEVASSYCRSPHGKMQRREHKSLPLRGNGGDTEVRCTNMIATYNLMEGVDLQMERFGGLVAIFSLFRWAKVVGCSI